MNEEFKYNHCQDCEHTYDTEGRCPQCRSSRIIQLDKTEVRNMYVMCLDQEEFKRVEDMLARHGHNG